MTAKRPLSCTENAKSALNFGKKRYPQSSGEVDFRKNQGPRSSNEVDFGKIHTAANQNEIDFARNWDACAPREADFGNNLSSRVSIHDGRGPGAGAGFLPGKPYPTTLNNTALTTVFAQCRLKAKSARALKKGRALSMLAQVGTIADRFCTVVPRSYIDTHFPSRL